MKISKILLSIIAIGSFAFATVNINTASKEKLMSLNGIGEAKANAIIEHRKTNKFKSIDELKNVNGIGNKIFDSLKNDIAISGETNIKEKAKSTRVKKDTNDKNVKEKQAN